jgi:hypothetical protein
MLACVTGDAPAESRLIDSIRVQPSSLSGKWASFSAGLCGAKALIVYNQLLYLMVNAFQRQ